MPNYVLTHALYATMNILYLNGDIRTSKMSNRSSTTGLPFPRDEIVLQLEQRYCEAGAASWMFARTITVYDEASEAGDQDIRVVCYWLNLANVQRHERNAY